MYYGYCQAWSDGKVSQHRTIGECREYINMSATLNGAKNVLPSPVNEPWVAGFDEETFFAIPNCATALGKKLLAA